MKSPDFLRLALPSAFVLAVGAGACGGARTASTNARQSNCSPTQALESVRLIGGDREGSINAVNGGDCASIYDINTFRTLGQIAHNQAFVIQCIDGPEPLAFRITLDDPNDVIHAGIQGEVNLGRQLITKHDQGNFFDIKSC